MTYTLATLCYLFDAQGRLLLLHRHKQPNLDRYSPVGGKLETSLGESPAQCAQREIQEETGLIIAPQRLHLTGLVSEQGFNGQHWLMFLYEVLGPVDLDPSRVHLTEGRLAWVSPEQLPSLPMPETDRRVIWPEFFRHRGGFFSLHIDCRENHLRFTLDQSLPARS